MCVCVWVRRYWRKATKRPAQHTQNINLLMKKEREKKTQHYKRRCSLSTSNRYSYFSTVIANDLIHNGCAAWSIAPMLYDVEPVVSVLLLRITACFHIRFWFCGERFKKVADWMLCYVCYWFGFFLSAQFRSTGYAKFLKKNHLASKEPTMYTTNDNKTHSAAASST